MEYFKSGLIGNCSYFSIVFVYSIKVRFGFGMVDDIYNSPPLCRFVFLVYYQFQYFWNKLDLDVRFAWSY